ncbi:hypothetical protein GGS21DRAFT_459282 [Xylaria nigripes]|nr:hypothetical protein GGS21DRAFT_459282 [Xylaria nigripes]
MTSRADGFPQFSKLPPELRDLIWSFAFPDTRTFEVLDAPCSHEPQVGPQIGPSVRIRFADARNEPPPLLAQVCRDARHAVLRHYKPIAFSGVVKHINPGRDIFFLDSHLQIRRLLKVIRWMSRIETVRRNITMIALGTSWCRQNGLHLRIFDKVIQTRQSAARLLSYLSKFPHLKVIILVVYQRSRFHMNFTQPSRQTLDRPLSHGALWNAYHSQLKMSRNLDDHWLHRPCQTRLDEYDFEDRTTENSATANPVILKPYSRDPKPTRSQVRDLQIMFEELLRSVAENEGLLPIFYKPPKLQMATLTWTYSSFGHGTYPTR